MSFRTRDLKPSTASPNPLPGWVRVAGWGSLLLPLPSVAWRIAMLAGLDVGFGMSGEFRSSGEAIGYVLGLEVLTLIVAVLGFGLIRPWGEVVPDWVLRLGGRTIPAGLVLIVGGIGCAVLLILIGSVLVKFVLVWTGAEAGWTPDIGMSPGQRTLLLACYIPFFAWPLAIAAALVGYGRRRLGTRRGGDAAVRVPVA
ncbi:hypothetical protein [Brevibacterium casei]